MKSNTNAYHFVTHWHLAASPEEVYRTLEDVNSLPQWWPSVYLDVNVREKGQPGGVGKVVELFTKGWLPYTLRWTFRVTHTSFPQGFSLEAYGDFEGRGIWTFTPEESGTHVTYDWRIEAQKPLLKKFSWLLKPVFSMNHEWAMRKGLESLILELRRRRGEVHVPNPPKPTFPHNRTNNQLL
ncbi:polyketide cyclase [Spirosoma taeanense]|uniref:Polyketide cyclase n=1 Tax=Spirosoma taeanense TaxID=2735870 RepID=A0A6M5YB02_9BACT|nr:SRPBCC family protein [Spirosoma taeanense]QJW90546.1 polyketide cyclase [Spirosoma taeanense]